MHFKKVIRNVFLFKINIVTKLVKTPKLDIRVSQYRIDVAKIRIWISADIRSSWIAVCYWRRWLGARGFGTHSVSMAHSPARRFDSYVCASFERMRTFRLRVASRVNVDCNGKTFNEVFAPRWNCFISFSSLLVLLVLLLASTCFCNLLTVCFLLCFVFLRSTAVFVSTGLA